MKSEWKPVAKGLPEAGKLCLCCGPKGGIYIGEILTSLGKPEWYSSSKTNPHPVAWMYLPEAYKG